MQATPAFRHTREQLLQAVKGRGRSHAVPLSERLHQAYEPVSDALERVKGNLLELAEDQSPFLAELLDHVLETKGKRLRPAITLLASRFHPNDGKTAEVMASAVELLHIASLIHDDTVDNSDIRRGKATISSRWGGNAAVLLGDYVFATSATFVCDTGNIQVIRRFSETIMELSAGELQEMEDAYSPVQPRESYLERIYNKTASLFTTAAESGAVLSGAATPVCEALKVYGYHLGMAFQIVDDILDFDATRQEVGKPVGNDLAQGTVTLPAIIALERQGPDGAVGAFLRGPGDEGSMRRAVKSIQESSVLDEAYGVAADFCGRALDSLELLDASPARDSLEELVSSAVWRRS